MDEFDDVADNREPAEDDSDDDEACDDIDDNCERLQKRCVHHAQV